MLQQLAPTLHIASIPHRLMGVPIGARMTVVQLQDGGLWLHSPVTPSPELRRELDALGPVRHVVAPNNFHFLDFAAYKPLYPDAKFYAVPNIERKVKVPLDGLLSDEPQAAWRGQLEQVTLKGNAMLRECVFYHLASRTLILTDLCVRSGSNDPPLMRLFGTVIGARGRLGPPPLERFGFRFGGDKRIAKRSIEDMLQWDFDRVIVSHGEIVEWGGKAEFRDAWAWLLDG